LARVVSPRCHPSRWIHSSDLDPIQ